MKISTTDIIIMTTKKLSMSDSDMRAALSTWQANEDHTTLIDFIRSQNSLGEEEEDAGITAIKKRQWPLFWKTKEIRVNENGEHEEDASNAFASWLETNFQEGITDDEVHRHRAQVGSHELEASYENFMELAGGLQPWIEFGVILAILLLNVLTTVVQNGQEVEIEARDLVPDDFVVTEDGNTVPCDGRLLDDYDDKVGSQAAEIRKKATSHSNRNGTGEAPRSRRRHRT
ncbi:hypothetical protein CF319_g8909 [Tilletia indica]|nr:hypothetical protein CF319_g8909 [Tilletia indica]